MIRRFAATSTLIACLALAACGGGGGSDSGAGSGVGESGGGGGGPPPMTQYVAPADNVFVAAIDPTNPGSVIAPSVSSYAGARLFTTGTVVAGSPYLSNQADYSQIYKASDGHLYRLDMLTAGTPAARQVSSEMNATTDDLCSLNGANTNLGTDVNYVAVLSYNDFSNPENSVYFYRLPGPDGTCDTSDDVVYMVKLGMGSGDAPILARMPMAVVHSASTGAITGFIVNEGAAVTMYDANFQNRTVLATPASPIGVGYALANSGSYTATGGLFVFDGNIVHIDYVAGAVSASLFTVPNWSTTTRFSNSASLTTLYFGVDTSNHAQQPVTLTSALYSMPLDGSAAPSQLSTESGVLNQVTMPVGGTTVAYAIVPPKGVYTIRTVSGAGVVSTAIATSGGNGSFYATAADIYYTDWTITAPSSTTRIFANTTTGIVGTDGTVIEAPVANSRFIATQRDTSGSGWLNVVRALGLSPVTAMSNTNGITYTEDGISGSTLEVVDTASNTVTVMLGTLPAGSIMTGSGTLTGTAGYIDGMDVNSTGDPTTRSLLYLDTANANSLGIASNNLP